MTCLVCGESDAAGECSFHAGRAHKAGTTDGRNDYTDYYRWSCCAKTELAKLPGELPPDRSPGCLQNDLHLTAANVAFVHSPEQEAFARECASAIQRDGLTVTLTEFEDLDDCDLESFTLLALFPDPSQVEEVSALQERTAAFERAPWFLAFNVDPDSANLKAQTTVADTERIVTRAVFEGLAAWHGRNRKSPFNLFLSYRHKDEFIAQELYSHLSCWWDRAVLGPGVEWSSEIENGIRDCSLFMLLMNGELPRESYVWNEIELAIKYERDVAILALGNEDEAVLERFEIDPASLERYTITDSALGDPEYQRMRVNKASIGSSTLFVFRHLSQQLGIPKASRDAGKMWQAKVPTLCSYLHRYPDYQFYSNREPVPMTNLLEPVDANDAPVAGPYIELQRALYSPRSEPEISVAVEEGEEDVRERRHPIFEIGAILAAIGIFLMVVGEMPYNAGLWLFALGGALAMTNINDWWRSIQ